MKMIMHAIHPTVWISDRALELLRATIAVIAPYALIATVLLARQA